MGKLFQFPQLNPTLKLALAPPPPPHARKRQRTPAVTLLEIGSSGEDVMQCVTTMKTAKSRPVSTEMWFDIESAEDLIDQLSEALADAKCRRSQRESGQ
jgi:hypothetical protein